MQLSHQCQREVLNNLMCHPVCIFSSIRANFRQWTSFLAAGSTSIYVYLYSFYYFFFKTKYDSMGYCRLV